jgi:Na+/H+ antiporter NhaC
VDPPDVSAIQNALSGSFRFNLLLLLPLAVILWFAVKKLPSLPGSRIKWQPGLLI